MTWQEDLRHVSWNGRAHTVLDRIEEAGRVFLGLVPSEEVAGLAQARDGGTRPAAPRLIWVEEVAGGFRALSRKEEGELTRRRRERALQAFRKA